MAVHFFILRVLVKGYLKACDLVVMRIDGTSWNFVEMRGKRKSVHVRHFRTFTWEYPGNPTTWEHALEYFHYRCIGVVRVSAFNLMQTTQ